jgi:hypothetical protein
MAGGVMIPDEEDGVRVLFANVGYRVGEGLIGLLAGQGAIDEIVDHVYDNEGAVFHAAKLRNFLLDGYLINSKESVNL